MAFAASSTLVTSPRPQVLLDFQEPVEEVRPATPSVASRASKASRASIRSHGSCASLGRRICSQPALPLEEPPEAATEPEAQLGDT